MKNIRKSITALFVSGILIYFLIKTNDLLTRIVIIPFLVFSISFFIEKILLILNKKSLAKKISKIYCSHMEKNKKIARGQLLILLI